MAHDWVAVAAVAAVDGGWWIVDGGWCLMGVCW